MNYKKIYYQLITKRLKEKLHKSDMGEEHHIIPRSFFPEKTPKKVLDCHNIVRLTLREHFIAHCLLARMYEHGSDKWLKMGNAITAMKTDPSPNQDRYINARLFEFLRDRYYKQRNLNFEKEGIKYVKNICDFIDSFGNTPKKNKETTDDYERFLGRKLTSMRQSKRGNGLGLFFDSYQELADARGYHNLFEIRDPEKNGLIHTDNICDWCDTYGQIPREDSENSEESILGIRLQYMRQSKRVNENKIDTARKTRFYESCLELAIERGYPNLFDKDNLKECRLNNIVNLCDWIDKHKRNPQKSDNTIENSLFVQLNNIKRAKRGDVGNIFYIEYQELVESRGYPTLFDIINTEQIGLDKLCELCDWMDENNRIPKNVQNDKYEKHLALQLRRFKKRKHDKSAGTFYKSFIDLIVSRGYPELFDNLIERRNTTIINLCEWIIVNKRKPNKKQTKEKSFYNQLSNIKKLHKLSKLDQKSIDIIKSYSLEKEFNL